MSCLWIAGRFRPSWPTSPRSGTPLSVSCSTARPKTRHAVSNTRRSGSCSERGDDGGTQRIFPPLKQGFVVFTRGVSPPVAHHWTAETSSYAHTRTVDVPAALMRCLAATRPPLVRDRAGRLPDDPSGQSRLGARVLRGTGSRTGLVSTAVAQSSGHRSAVRGPGEPCCPRPVVPVSAPTPAHVPRGSRAVAPGAGDSSLPHYPRRGDASGPCLV